MVKLKHYTNEFKEEAVRRYQQSIYGLPVVASEIGISVSTLHRWVKEKDANVSAAAEEKDTTRELMDEIKDLKEQNLSYMKTIAYLSRICKRKLTIDDLSNIIKSDF